MSSLALQLSGLRPLEILRLQVGAVTTTLLYLFFIDFSLYHRADPDYWWHLRTGQIIVQEHVIPRHDQFSFTVAGSSWIPAEWLSEAIIYSLDRLVGYFGTALIFAAIAALSLAVIHRLLLRLEVPRRATLLLVGLAGLASVPYWAVRPQVFTFLFVAIFLRALFLRYREGRGHLWYLPLLMLPWANLHGGFILGLLLLAVFAVSLIVDRALSGQEVDLREPVVVLFASLAIVAINPAGVNLLPETLNSLLPGQAGLGFIAEWRTPNFHLPYHWPLVAGLALLAVTGLRRKQNAFPVMLAVLFVALALHASRGQPLFALVMPILVGERWLEARGQEKAREPGAGGIVWANWAMLVTALAVFALFFFPRTTAGEAGRDAPVAGYPEDAAQYVLQNHAPARVFNFYDWGGYLIHAWYPQQKVFVDGRSYMYGSEFLEDYTRAYRLQERWDQILDKYAIELALIESDSPLANALRLHPRWEETFRGGEAAVFVRSASPREASAGQGPAPSPAVDGQRRQADLR